VATDLVGFPNDDQADALRTLAERVNGFVYAGDRSRGS
jgi:hypothetical protein